MREQYHIHERLPYFRVETMVNRDGTLGYRYFVGGVLRENIEGSAFALRTVHINGSTPHQFRCVNRLLAIDKAT